MEIPVKKFALLLIAGLLPLCLPAFAEEPIFTTITMKNVLLYESPMTSSPIVRRVFTGEVLKIVETVKTEHGEIWGKVFLTPTQSGYIQGAYFANNGSLQQQIWKPEE